MFCTYCNQQNSDRNKFCESCGKPLAVKPAGTTSSSVSVSKTTDWSKWLRRLPSLGAALVIWGFFLPWALVSCSISFGTSETGITASGYEIATGNFAALEEIRDFGSMLGASEELNVQESSTPLLWLIFVLGIIGLLALNGRVSGSIVAILAGIFGVAGMTIATIQFSEVGKELSTAGLKLQFQNGFWLTWIGFVWLALLAIMTVRQKR